VYVKVGTWILCVICYTLILLNHVDGETSCRLGNLSYYLCVLYIVAVGYGLVTLRGWLRFDNIVIIRSF